MRATLVAAALVLSLPARPALPALPALPAPPAAPQAPAKPKPRLFPAQDLGLLEAPDREQWQKPEVIMDALNIADGAVVAELGAASGWFTIRLARRVGPNGIVYAEDIQPPMIEFIGQRMQRENLPWVVPVLGTATDPRVPAGLDAVLISDVFHEMDDPVALLKNAAALLKPQGLLGVVDFLPGGGGPGPAPEERPDPQEVMKAAAAAGLQFRGREDMLPFVYLLKFSRATAS
jgi:ubiquinone/menaquinone biosynthesis C-methylase UbiE